MITRLAHRLPIVILAAVLVAGACTSPPAAGPLAQQLANDSFGTYADPGEEFSFGWVSFQNSGTAPVVIDGVRLEQNEGIELLDSWVTPSAGLPYGIADAPGFPPSGWEAVHLDPAIGATIPSYDGTQSTDVDLLMHLRVPQGLATDSFYGVTVDYHDDSGRYEFTYPTGWRACAPREAWTFCGGPHAASPAPNPSFRSPSPSS